MAPPTPVDASLEGMAAYARGWQGVATAELLKRVVTADCLDRERAAGRIR